MAAPTAIISVSNVGPTEEEVSKGPEALIQSMSALNVANSGSKQPDARMLTPPISSDGLSSRYHQPSVIQPTHRQSIPPPAVHPLQLEQYQAMQQQMQSSQVIPTMDVLAGGFDVSTLAPQQNPQLVIMYNGQVFPAAAMSQLQIHAQLGYDSPPNVLQQLAVQNTANITVATKPGSTQEQPGPQQSGLIATHQTPTSSDPPPHHASKQDASITELALGNHSGASPTAVQSLQSQTPSSTPAKNTQSTANGSQKAHRTSKLWAGSKKLFEKVTQGVSSAQSDSNHSTTDWTKPIVNTVAGWAKDTSTSTSTNSVSPAGPKASSAQSDANSSTISPAPQPETQNSTANVAGVSSSGPNSSNAFPVSYPSYTVQPQPQPTYDSLSSITGQQQYIPVAGSGSVGYYPLQGVALSTDQSAIYGSANLVQGQQLPGYPGASSIQLPGQPMMAAPSQLGGPWTSSSAGQQAQQFLGTAQALVTGPSPELSPAQDVTGAGPGSDAASQSAAVTGNRVDERNTSEPDAGTSSTNTVNGNDTGLSDDDAGLDDDEDDDGDDGDGGFDSFFG